jgi:cytochrome d ubiquinol oxidase subunit II
MSVLETLAILLGLCLTAYGVFAGTDFGVGILELSARDEGGHRNVTAVRTGPLWEASHVWLVLSIAVLFAAFPSAFAVAGTALRAPLGTALVAVIVRSAALGARISADPGTRRRRRRLFALSSAVAAFGFGAAAGGVAQISAVGTAVTGGRVVPGVPWDDGLSIVIGLLAVALCANLGATTGAARLAHGRDGRLAASFARRGIWTGVAVAVLIALAVAIAALQAPALAHRLEGHAAPIVIAGLVAAALAPLLLARARYRPARFAALLSTSSLLWGWFVAQAPRLIGPHLTIDSAAASPAALGAACVAISLVLLASLPALYLLSGALALRGKT